MSCKTLQYLFFLQFLILVKSLFAGVHVVDSHTLLTTDIAAPVEDTVALLLSLLSPCVVSSSAAQQVTSVYAMRRQVADAITRAKGARQGIRVAEVRRAFIIHQVAVGGRFEVVVLGSEGLHPPTGLLMFLHHHLRRTVIFILHVVTDYSEIGLRPPARLDLTAP